MTVKSKTMKCDIIIAVWDELQCTKECIQGIERSTKVPYRLILIDNGSGDETKNYLRQLADNNEKITLLRNKENLGFVKAANQGLRESSAPYVCTMNNDTIASNGWLTRMINLAESRPDIGLVNPRSENPGHLSVDEYAKALRKNKGKYIETNQCLGFCMLVKREIIEKIGYLDEAYGIGNFDDTDFSMKAHRVGYKCVCASDAYVYHNWHTSFKKKDNREELVRINEKIFVDKWGKFLRIAYPILAEPRDNFSSDVYTSVGLARQWNWVHAWIRADGDLKKRLDSRSIPRHQSLRLFYLSRNRIFFFITVLFKLVERSLKRKKQFDAVLVSDPGFFKKLSKFRKLFKTPVFFIEEGEQPIDIRNEASWQKRADFIKERLRKE